LWSTIITAAAFLAPISMPPPPLLFLPGLEIDNTSCGGGCVVDEERVKGCERKEKTFDEKVL